MMRTKGKRDIEQSLRFLQRMYDSLQQMHKGKQPSFRLVPQVTTTILFFFVSFTETLDRLHDLQVQYSTLLVNNIGLFFCNGSIAVNLLQLCILTNIFQFRMQCRFDG